MCLQNIIGISAKLRVLGPGQIFDNTFRILLLWRRQLQTNRTHIDPTLHVGPNNILLKLPIIIMLSSVIIIAAFYVQFVLIFIFLLFIASTYL